MTALASPPRWKPKRTILPGGELEVVGPMGLVKVTKLPLITVGTGWYEDLRIVAPNGRRRQPITCSGHRMDLEFGSPSLTCDLALRFGVITQAEHDAARTALGMSWYRAGD